ncbi:unnamed protein product [Brassica rapa subsp. narinosa]|uniref:(rape) hypothetical protein n=1 Tax=Brassica napus TaxID=3708 RepID=A0A816ZCN9_BRANA|nr:unnamed protein product [Brassica napus]
MFTVSLLFVPRYSFYFVLCESYILHALLSFFLHAPLSHMKIPSKVLTCFDHRIF